MGWGIAYKRQYIMVNFLGNYLMWVLLNQTHRECHVGLQKDASQPTTALKSTTRFIG